MGNAIWLVGAPAAGKTTLARALLFYGEEPFTIYDKPKWTLSGPRCAAGHYTGSTFDGADRLPYNGVRPALEMWDALLRPHVALTLFDGDRTSSAACVEWVTPRVERVACLHLVASASTLEARRDARGSKQNASWAKGRATKSARFAESFGSLAVQIDADQPVDRVLDAALAGLARVFGAGWAMPVEHPPAAREYSI